MVHAARFRIGGVGSAATAFEIWHEAVPMPIDGLSLLRGVSMKFWPFLILCLGCSIAPQSPANAAGWSVPATLGQSSLYYMTANNVSVAVSTHALAQSVAVWTEPSTMTVKYAIRKNGIWSGSKVLYTSNANAAEQLTDPEVVIDAAGTATAVWGSTKQGAVAYCAAGNRVVRCIPLISFVKVATLSPGGTAWTKANLSSQGWGVSDVKIGLDDNRNATALWKFKATSSATPTLQSASKPPSGGWTVPTNVCPANICLANASLPQLAVGPSGAALVAWTEQTAVSPLSTWEVKSVYRESLSASWGTPETAASQGTPINYLSATVNSNNQAHLVFDNNSVVQWAQRTSPSGWNMVRVPSSNAAGPTIASAGTDRFLITWLNMDPMAGTIVEAEIVSAAGTSHGSWLVNTSVPPHAALSADGSATVAWSDDLDYTAYAVSAAPDGLASVPTPQVLGSSVWGMGVSLAAGGNVPTATATAVWLRGAGANYQIQIVGSSYKP